MTYDNQTYYGNPQQRVERRVAARDWSSRGGSGINLIGLINVILFIVLAHLTFNKGTGGNHSEGFSYQKCDTSGMQKVMLGIIIMSWLTIFAALCSSCTACFEMAVLRWKASPLGNTISGLCYSPMALVHFILVVVFSIWFLSSDCRGAHFAGMATAFIVCYWALVILSCVLVCCIICCLGFALISLGMITAPFALLAAEDQV